MPTPAPAPAPAAPTTPAPCYTPPRGTEKALSLRLGARTVRIHAAADWLIVREHGVPAAEMFYVHYALEPRNTRRPITFLFNGGPGAASAFLHMGTAGPMRIEFTPTGDVLPPPARPVPNAETWLAFSDLVFVDPVGTGLSRTVHESRLEQTGLADADEQRAKRTGDLPTQRKTFYKLKRDIEVLCEFVSAFLSRVRRWESPVLVAGESYGGFRVGKLLRALPERGVGLSGAILVSPALDFMHLIGSDYDLLPWITRLPTMALAARHHGRLRGRFKGLSPERLRGAAEAFAAEELAVYLLRAERPATTASRTIRTLAELTGLPDELVARCNGRVSIERFARELLRDQGLVCGLYDAAITGPDVFPDREGTPNPDPPLAAFMSAFAAGVNAMLRSTLGLSTEREYLLLNEDTNKAWSDDRPDGFWQRPIECADDMRYGLALNPSLRVLISHGWFDLVTPYYSSAQAVAALRLPPALRARITLTNYNGGHMFYSWQSSRKAFQRDAARVAKPG